MILNIQRLWTNQESQQMLYGNHFYRPSETYHLSTRKFLEKVCIIFFFFFMSIEFNSILILIIFRRFLKLI